MLQVTREAKDKLHETLSSAGHDDSDKCFRVIPKDDQYLTLALAEPSEGDALVTKDGNIVLALPERLQELLKNKTLDIGADGKLSLS